MKDNNDFGKRVSEAQAEFEDRDVWTDKLEGIPVAQQVENAEQVLARASMDEEGVEELRPTREQEKSAQRDYDWSRRANFDHPPGRTLAEEERMLGEEAEMERLRERAVAAHERGIDRARSCREQSEREARERHADFSARAAVAVDRDPEVDPRSKLSQEELGAVNRYARKLANYFEDGPSRAALSKELGELVESGRSPGDAMMQVKARLVDSEWAVLPLKDVDAAEMQDKWSSLLWEGRGDFEVSIQGEVTKLYEPSDANQQQVGWVEDETGKAKVTVWAASNCETVLREGDEVRLRGLKVDEYRGMASLAVTSTTEVTVLERGEGPERIHGHLTNANFSNSAESGEIEESDTRLAETRHRRPSTLSEHTGEELTQTMVAAERAPEWWVNREDVVPVEEAPFATSVDE